MSIQARRELLWQVAPRYREWRRKEKSNILKEFVASTGHTHKYAIRLLGARELPQPREIKRPREPHYGKDSPIKNTLSFSWPSRFRVGDFVIAPHLVDHSSFSAFAFEIAAAGKRIFYSGDFREHGHIGRAMDILYNKVSPGMDALMEAYSFIRCGTGTGPRRRRAGFSRSLKALESKSRPCTPADTPTSRPCDAWFPRSDLNG